MNRGAWIGLFCTVAVALFLRVGDLALRPLHNDEAINAFKVRQLWNGGGYRYDPHEYHGPTLPYATLPVLDVAARFQPDQPDEVSLRVVPMLFGLGLIPLYWVARRALGGGNAVGIWGGLWIAVSPAMVYYSRYYIHELLLVFFTAGLLVAWWRYVERPGRRALLAGGAVGLMYATKETFVLSMAALGLAWVAAVGLIPGENDWRRELAVRGKGGIVWWTRAWGRWRAAWAELNGREVGWAAVAGLVVAAALFTSFGANPRGVVDAVRTYLPWGDRAGGASPHMHAWSFYFERLGWWGPGVVRRWSELVVMGLAVVGAAEAWRGDRRLPERRAIAFLAVYTVVLAALYSAIPYKTPWCFLGFLHGVLVLAGLGAAAAVGRPRWVAVKVAVGLALLAVAADQASWARKYSRELAADFRNPFVYGHTSADIFNLLEQIEGVTALHPDGRRTVIDVVVPDASYWPLPWYLRRYEQVWWREKLPEPVAAPVVVVAVKAKAGLEEASKGAWKLAGMFELRPRYFVELYVEAEAWRRYVNRPATTGR